METSSAPSAPPERLVNWRLLRRRLTLARVAAAALFLVALASISASAYLWNRPPPTCEGAAEGRFRFDQVYVYEGAVEGNNTTFVVKPWFSNEGNASLGQIQVVVHIIDGSRRLVVADGEQVFGELGARSTRNASLPFRVENTRGYQIEILILEGGFFVAKAYGSIGFQWYLDDVRLDRAAVTTGAFSYDYSGR